MNGRDELDVEVVAAIREAIMTTKAPGQEDGFDLKRMEAILELGRRRYLAKLEAEPHDTFSGYAISEFLFGPSFIREEGKADKTGEAMMALMRRAETCFLSWLLAVFCCCYQAKVVWFVKTS